MTQMGFFDCVHKVIERLLDQTLFSNSDLKRNTWQSNRLRVWAVFCLTLPLLRGFYHFNHGCSDHWVARSCACLSGSNVFIQDERVSLEGRLPGRGLASPTPKSFFLAVESCCQPWRDVPSLQLKALMRYLHFYFDKLWKPIQTKKDRPVSHLITHPTALRVFQLIKVFLVFQLR